MHTDTTPRTTRGTDPSEIAAELQALLDDLAAAVNDHDVERSMRHFLPSASSGTTNGARARGTEELHAAHLAAFGGGLGERLVRFTLEDHHLLADDVAVAWARGRSSRRDGVDDGAPEMVALYVLVHDGAGWRVSDRQMTAVAT